MGKNIHFTIISVLYNSEEWIEKFIEELSQLRQLIAKGDETLEKAFAQVQQAHQSWLEGYDKKD